MAVSAVPSGASSRNGVAYCGEMVGIAKQTTPAIRAGIWQLVLLGAAIAVCVAAGVTALAGPGPAQSLGLPDPGELTTYGLPVVRTITEVAAMIAVGALMLGSLLVPPRKARMESAGYRTLRSASYAAGTWAIGALSMVPLTVADSIGRPVTDVLGFGELIGMVPALDTAWAWALTALLATVLFAGCRVAHSLGATAALGGLAVITLLPVASTGHSSAGGGHDLATDSLMVHVVAAALWVGGLVALLGLAGHRGAAGVLTVAVRRFSALALLCWLAMAVSGVLNACVRVTLPALFGSYYGLLVCAKTGCLLMLGGLGYLQRRRAVPLVARGIRGTLLQLGGCEVLLMMATVGLAVALGRSAPPVEGVSTPSRTAVLIGYDLPGPPTPVRLVGDWRVELIFGTVALAAATVYLRWVRRTNRAERRWPLRRTVSWLSGCVVLLVVTSSGIGRYAPAVFSVGLVQHTVLLVVVPLLLVLGAPVRLAWEVLPRAPEDSPAGARELLTAASGSRLAAKLTHPVVALALFTLPGYPHYLSGLFDSLLSSHSLGLLAGAVDLAGGLLFYCVLFGPRLGTGARVGLLAGAAALLGGLGVLLVTGGHRVLGLGFYTGLGLGWDSVDLARDQRTGGVLELALVALSCAAVLAVLLVGRKPRPALAP